MLQHRGLIFPLIILEQFPAEVQTSEAAYCSKLAHVGPMEILHDYAHQILEISRIYAIKYHHINRSVTRFRWLAGTWLVTILLLLALVILR